MVLAPTVEAVARIRESAQFTRLTNAGRAAINNYTDDVQFLSACVGAGGVAYGRSSSQAAESQNHHLAGARFQDLVSSVLWVMRFEARRFQEWAGKSARETSYAPPSIRQRMENVTNVDASGPFGEVSENAALSVESTNVFTVRTTPQRCHKVSRSLSYNVDGDLVSLFGSCSCGRPQIDFSCKHMYTAALAGHYDERKLILIELTTVQWKS